MSFTRTRYVAWLLYGLGATAMVATALSDLVGGQSTGIGVTQATGALLGMAVVLFGVRLQTAPAGLAESLTPAVLPRIELRSVGKFVVILAQLVLLLAVVTRFRLENPAFYETVFPLVLVGFAIHHVLPLPQRLPFFVALSCTAIVSVFGLADAAWLIALGVALAGICRLPISFRVRVALLLAAGAGLAALRGGLSTTPWSGAIWPILASMFMFRLILYMYDLRHAQQRPTLAHTWSYFFMLPNVAFPLFPVVDFATFKRTYYDQDAYDIYQRGLRWMLRGAAHLIAYRFVYQHLVLSQADVQTSAQLAQYLIANFLLYLRVSGQFHMIVGMLHLFGFRLPETHRFFYLSASFTDFWRRINIYWKEFMMKVVYFPSYFRLRRLGHTPALVLATIAVFAATWFLHAYQWFWLLGRFLLSWTDVLFWSILAGFLVVNSLRETRSGRKRALGTQRFSLRGLLGSALRTAITFAVLCTLWSLWTSPTVADWIELWRVDDLSAIRIAFAAAVLFGGTLLLVTLFRERLDGEEAARVATRPPRFAPAVWSGGVGLLALYTLGSPQLAERTNVRLQEVMRDLRVTELNKADAAMLQRGYYEELVGVNRFNGQLWEVYARRSGRTGLPSLESEKGVHYTETYLRVELRPMIGIPYMNGTFRTNRWRMRDQHYTRAKPAGAWRIALLGPSHVVGWSVLDNQTFESLLERRLNDDNNVTAYSGYEILNFAVPGYSIPQQLILLNRRVFDFEPDAVFLVTTPRDGEIAANHLRNMMQRGVEIPFDYLRHIVQESGIRGDLPESENNRRLRAYQDTIIQETYVRFARAARMRSSTPVWVYLPLPGQRAPDGIAQRMKSWAQEAGFELLDLGNIYDGHELRTIQYAGWDEHPNTLGHQVIAEGMFAALLQQPELLGLEGMSAMTTSFSDVAVEDTSTRVMPAAQTCTEADC